MPRTELAQTHLCLKRDRDNWIHFNAPSLKIANRPRRQKGQQQKPRRVGRLYLYTVYLL